MKNKTFDDKDFKTACKMVSRSFDSLSELHDSGICPPKKARASGGGRKKAAQEARESLFSYFDDIRCSLKGRFPKRMLKLEAKPVYSDWIRDHPILGNERPLKFGNHWIKDWESEYNISLRKPNKRCSISKRIEKSVWKVTSKMSGWCVIILFGSITSFHP